MNKAFALTLLLCLLGGSYATTYYVASYSATGCGNADFVDEVSAIPNDDTCQAGLTSGSIKLAANLDLTYGFPANCGSGGTALTSITAGTCKDGSGVSYKVSTTASAPVFYLGVYSSSTTGQDSFVYKETLTLGSCVQLTSDTAKYAKLTRAAGVYTLVFSATASTCASPTTTITPTLTAAVSSGSYYYALSSTAITLTTPTLYVATYSTADCSDDVFVEEQTIVKDAACAAETNDATKYAKLTFAFPTFSLSYGCASGCSTGCDATALTTVVNGACAAGTAAWYKVATSSLDPDASAGVLSFAALLLCALFALLF